MRTMADGWIQVGTDDYLDLHDPSPMADAGTLQACLAACAGGTEEIYEFCRSLPNPAWRAACWGLALGSETACAGWCYIKFS